MFIKSISISFFIFFAIPTFSQSKYSYEQLKNQPLITKDNASKIITYKNTPESVVTYFYASKIREDNLWNQVIDPSTNLEDYEKWKFLKFQILGKTKLDTNRVWIKIVVEIEYKGEKDSETDEVEVKLINGKWVIMRVPH